MIDPSLSWSRFTDILCRQPPRKIDRSLAIAELLVKTVGAELFTFLNCENESRLATQRPH